MAEELKRNTLLEAKQKVDDNRFKVGIKWNHDQNRVGNVNVIKTNEN